ncbi:MAG: hypothetical protein KJ718_03485 [Nanoarchaeota archaeon]|nr:hypothetical protein [Nanoarchaeota archaeon]MBU1051592.1 hypothetical protein [Nanoarchaeota archaeon]MBU1988623.1 hypothetical protein [Nanoarchaeota archaeon]
MENKLERKILQEWKNIIFNAIFAILNVLFAVLFYENILLTSTLVGIVSVGGLIKWKSKLTLLIFIFSALLGTTGEIIAVNQGVWAYSFSNFISVPFWLFLVWGNAGAFVHQTALEFKKLGVKK